MIRLAFAIVVLACSASSAATNGVQTAQSAVQSKQERKAEHYPSKIVLKARSDKKSEWKKDKELPLMFSNNPKAKKSK